MANFAVPDIYAEIDRQAPQFGVDPRFAKALLTSENTDSGDPTKLTSYSGDAVSGKQARGILQVIPSTALGLQQAGFLPPDWKHDPNNLPSQVQAGLAAMKEMSGRQKNPNDLLELASMYNGGTQAWNDYRNGKPQNPETTHYLKKVTRAGMDFGIQMTPQQIEQAASTSNSTTTGPGSSGSGSSSSTSRRTTTYDPNALADYSKVTDLLTGGGGLFDQAQSAVTDRTGQKAIVGQELMDSIIKAGQDAGASAQATAQVAAAGQIRRAAILTQANLNPDQANNRAQQALDQLDSTSAAIDALRPAIDEKMSVGFFDNPLQYLANATRLPGMVGQYNNLVRVQQDMLGRYDAAAGIAKSQIDMGTALDADKTLEAGAALAQAEASKAVATAKTAQFQMASKSAADALTAVQLGLQASGIALQKAQLTKEVQTQREGETQREMERRIAESQQSDLNLMIKAAGGQPMDMARFKQLPPKVREDIMQTVASKKFGKDFVESLQFVQNWGDINTMAEQGQLGVRTWVNAAQQKASALTLDEQTKASNPASPTYNKSFNPGKAMLNNLAAVASTYEAQANVNMRNVDDHNPYKIDYTGISKAPELKDNIWAQTINKYGPKGTEPIYDTIDEQQLMKRAVTQIKLSTDPAMAVKKFSNDIADYYAFATKQTAMNSRWALFGLAKPELTYPVQMPGITQGKPTSVDLGNKATVENILTKKVAEEIRSDSIMTMFGEGAWVDMTNQPTSAQDQFLKANPIKQPGANQ